jgi:hypothetical protein
MNIKPLTWREQTQERRAENASKGSSDKEMSFWDGEVSFVGIRKG